MNLAAGKRPIWLGKQCTGGRLALRQRGVALVLVIWVLALLATMAAGLVATQRTDSAMAQNLLEVREGRALAEAGIQLAIANLLDAAARDEWPADGRYRNWRFDGQRVDIAIEDEGSRIDLNAADPELIGGLLEAVGLQPADRDALLDAILDWRDEDSQRRLNGAEAPHYRAEDRDYGPRNGRFESVDELRLVLGMDSAIFDALSPALTVYTGKNSVNPAFATPLVLAAVPGMTADRIAAYVAQRDERATPGSNPTLPPGAKQGFLTVTDGPVYRIRARARLDSGRLVTVTMIVNIGGRSYQVVAAHYPRAKLPASPAPGSAQGGDDDDR
jgi:general secretion pathway protein K